MSEHRPSPLGLFDDGDERPSAVAFLDQAARIRESVTTAAATQDGGERPRLSVIVPARDEAAVLGACLNSLLAQDDADLFLLGRDWELIVVDDASTDGTRAIVEQRLRPGLMLMAAPALELRGSQRAFTGKTNACWAAAQRAAGAWMLFTDADTLHEAYSMARALREAEKYGVTLLSYSPRQLLTGIAQRLVMPLIFSELASVYPPADVNDPTKKVAAANGQFLLVECGAYFAVGGHRAVGRSVLEDVDLAWNIKRSGRAIRLRYAPDAVSARMYANFRAMWQGWTKNLYLLFPHTLSLTAWRALDVLLWLLPMLWVVLPWLVLWQKAAIGVLWLRTALRFYTRVRWANMGFTETAVSPLGLPLFIAMLVASCMRHRVTHSIVWKGRAYSSGR